MKLATFNVNSIRARVQILEKWLCEVEPDLLFMQELKCKNEFFPEIFFKSLGYSSYFNGEKSYNGVGVLVKNNLNPDKIKINFGFDDESFMTRVLNFELNNNENNLKILCTYVPQGKSVGHEDFIIKKEFFKQVKNIIQDNLNLNNNFIWLGDLNVAPEFEDVTNPENKKDHVCFCAEIREIFKNTREGLTDIFRQFNKNPDEYTFYDYRVPNAVARKIGWRIDHILASKNLIKKFKSCYIDLRPRLWEKPSDHVPLIAEINL